MHIEGAKRVASFVAGGCFGWSVGLVTFLYLLIWAEVEVRVQAT